MKRTKPVPQKSNKATVYVAWAGGEDDINTLSKLVNGNIKKSTIKSWTSQWSRGKALPAIARSETVPMRRTVDTSTKNKPRSKNKTSTMRRTVRKEYPGGITQVVDFGLKNFASYCINGGSSVPKQGKKLTRVKFDNLYKKHCCRRTLAADSARFKTHADRAWYWYEKLAGRNPKQQTTKQVKKTKGKSNPALHNRAENESYSDDIKVRIDFLMEKAAKFIAEWYGKKLPEKKFRAKFKKHGLDLTHPNQEGRFEDIWERRRKSGKLQTISWLFYEELKKGKPRIVRTK